MQEVLSRLFLHHRGYPLVLREKKAIVSIHLSILYYLSAFSFILVICTLIVLLELGVFFLFFFVIYLFYGVL